MNDTCKEMYEQYVALQKEIDEKEKVEKEMIEKAETKTQQSENLKVNLNLTSVFIK